MDGEWVMEKEGRNSDYRHYCKVDIMRDFVFSSFLAIAILALTPIALATHGEDAPFGTFLTEGDSSTTRERIADTESHFQERLVDQAADEDSPDSLNKVPDEGEDPPPLTAYGKVIKWFETHFKFTERIIRDIADVLERAADDAKKAEGFKLRNHLINNLRSGLPVPRSIWGVTVSDVSSSRTAELRAALDKHYHVSDEFDGQLKEFDALLKTYAKPETLFRRANGGFANMVDVEFDPGTGAIHACVHFLRELSIVRQLAQVAFPNIEIADVPPLASCRDSLGHRVWGRHQEMVQGRAPYSIRLPDDLSSSRSLEMGRAYDPQGSATTGIDISESVVSWVRSLADNVHTGFVRILKTERLSSKKDQINNEKLIERVKNANMMVQALILYTSGVRLQNEALNVKSTALWQLILRLPGSANRAGSKTPVIKAYTDALYRCYEIAMDRLGRIRKFWDDLAADEDKDAPFGTFLTEGGSSRTRERFANRESLFQERLVDQAADEEFLDSLDKALDDGDNWTGFKDDSAADEEFFDAIDMFPNEGRDDLALSRITTEDELEGELRIRFDNRKLTRLLAHKFKTRPPSDEQIREAVNQMNGQQLYLIVRCPVCLDSMDSETLMTPSCGHEIHERCLEASKNVCPICRYKVTHGNTKVVTLLKKLLELFEDESVIPAFHFNATSLVTTYFKATEKTIRDIANALEGAADTVKNAKTFDELQSPLIEIRRRGGPVARAIWGVTVFDYNLELSDWDKQRNIYSHLDDEWGDESDDESDDEWHNAGLFYQELMERFIPRLERYENDESVDVLNEIDFEISGAKKEFHAVLQTYQNPGTLFRRANGDFASMDDVKRDPKTGAFHARAHFLRELSIVRQLAQVAFPDIKIAPEPLSSSRSPTMGRANEPQGFATTAIDISESVISWVLSLADNVRTGLDQILQTEKNLHINKERLIERVESANMMVQALLHYTSVFQEPDKKSYAHAFNRLRQFALRRSVKRRNF